MKKKWDELSLEEQAEIMKVAVRNGIYDLYKIRDKYNEFTEGGDTNEKPVVYYKDDKGKPVEYSYNDYEAAVDAANRWRQLKENGHPYYLEPQNVLPEVTVTGYRPIELKTYYPLSKEYPLTGHSELYIPITNDVADDYELRTHEDAANNKSIALDIDKLSTAKDYNLLLNNCADSTLGYLNKMFGTSESPTLFTTPGDVRDFAVDTLHGKVINKNGIETVIIPRNKRNADALSKRAIELWNKNLDEGNGFIDYQHSLGGPLVEAANEYKHGGNTVGEFVDAIYENNPREEYLGEPSHHYDFTQSEEWANAHGYYPDARGHRDDKVKKVSHPSHPSRGTWDRDKFILSDFGMETPNYTLFGLNDGGQDPQATLIYDNGIVLPEFTVTPDGNYIENTYDNIRLHYANGGKIHIKPENRGKFTRLKKRTGHSASWFKEHGTPSQKKMAVFELNARKWKH